MMQNLLTKRLKDAKRELTNLKTAHMRGLGNLRVYEHTVSLDPTGHTSGLWYINVEATFDSQFSPYPIWYMLPKVGNDGILSVETVGFEYTNNGMGFETSLIYLYRSDMPELSSFTIVSTAPIASLSYTWGDV